MHMTPVVLVSGLIAATAAAQFDTFDSAMPSEPAKASLISLEDGMVPGTIAHLAIRYEIVDHWHIYWDGLNDSGMPPAITLNLPDGYDTLATQWPAPRRHILGQNDLIDHVLEGDVLAIIPIRVPTDATPGDTVTVTAESDWLVCNEACLLGKASLTLELPVVSEADESEHAGAFERTWKNTPIALRGDASKLGLEVAWEGSTLLVKNDAGGKIEFYPHESSTPLADRFADAVGDNGRLRLRLETPGVARGVLRISRREDDRRPSLIAIDLPTGKLINPRPVPILAYRPWSEIIDGPHPWPREPGISTDAHSDGRSGG